SILADDLARWRDTVDTAIEQGAEFEIEYRTRWLDDTLHWVLVRGKCFTDESGETNSIAGVSIDITEHKQAEKILREAEERYRALVEATSTTVWQANPEGGLTFVGEKWTEVSGQSVAEILKWGWLEALHPNDREHTIEVWQTALQNKTLYATEFRVLTVKNEYRWFAVNAVPIFDTVGNIREWVGFNTDITERKRAEINSAFLAEITQYLTRLTSADEIMRITTEKIGEYLNVSSCLFAEVDTALKTATVSHAWRTDDNMIDLVGHFQLSEFVSDAYTQAITKGKAIIINDIVKESLTAERAANFRQLKIGSFINTPFADSGHLTFVLGVYRQEPYEWRTDEIELLSELMTRIWTRIERVRAGKALRESEEKYRTLFDSIDQGFCLIEVIFDTADKAVDYRFLEINPSFEKLSGIPAVEARSGKTMRELVPNLEGKWFEIYGNVALTGEPSRFIEGSKALNRWFDVYAFRTGTSQTRKVAILFNDISIQKQAELEREELLGQLESERSRLNYLFQQAPAFVATLQGKDHVFELTNPSYQQLIGHRDVIGKTAREALPDISGQGYFELLDNVYQTGEAFIGREQSVEFQYLPDSPLEKRFVDFVFQPIFGADKSVSGIFVHGVDITEQVKARRQAENANRLKDEFLATLSHELRTPLNAILGWSQILKSRRIGENEREQALVVIERSARSQNQLIEDILDVSRIITGKLRLDVRDIDLLKIITAAVETARPAAEAKNIRLQMLLNPKGATISGDSDRLQQVIWNLLSNAIKFTPPDGQVKISLEPINSEVEIIVSDTGKGIESEFLPHVFERFRQSDGSMTRRHGGLGLGLAIVRQLVELHGGTVSVESQGNGLGTTFTVNLPLAPFRRESPGSLPPVHRASERNESIDYSPELIGLRVLLVDDEADSRELLNFILHSCGADTTTVNSATEALKMIKKKKFDVMISDIGMPEEDGFTLIGKIRELSDEQGGNIPAIALTAYARAEDRAKALRSGFQLHIAKPVDHLALVAAVANLGGKMRNSN
ncbi:MAG: ATP-binding protein, partial [Actinomycetota bacterium]